jgi:hypothetical protein
LIFISFYPFTIISPFLLLRKMAVRRNTHSLHTRFNKHFDKKFVYCLAVQVIQYAERRRH